MKILKTLAISACISLVAGSAFALPAKNQLYKSFNASQASMIPADAGTRITIVDNAGAPITVGVEGTDVALPLSPYRPDNTGWITNEDTIDGTVLSIRDMNSGEIIEFAAWHYAVINVHRDSNGDLTVDQISMKK